jgi:PAS domain S-box-containing protein
MKRLSSLQFRLSLWLGLLVIAVSTVLIAYFARVTRAEAVEKARIQMMATTHRRAMTLRQPMNRAINVARTVAQGLALARERGTQGSREETNIYLRRVLEGNPDFLDIFTIWEPNAFDGDDSRHANVDCHDSTGRFVPRWNRAGDGSIECEPCLYYQIDGLGDYYTIPRRSHREEVIEPYLYLLRGEPIFMTSLVAPILTGERFQGIVGVDYRLDYLQRILDQERLYGGAGSLYILSTGGVIAGATGHPEFVGQRRDDCTMLVALPHFDGDGVVARDGMLYASSKILTGDTEETWTVMISVPEKTITAEADRRIAVLVGGASTVSFLGVLLTLLLLRRTVAAKIERLTAATEAFAAGDYQTECTISGQDELHRLGAAFNVMAARIAASVGALRESEALLKAAFDNAFQYIALVSPEGELQFANRSILSLVGASSESVVHRQFLDCPWWSHSPEEQEKVRQAIISAASGDFVRLFTTHRACDGALRQVDFSLSPLHDSTGAIVYLIAEGRDITELERAEAARLESESLLNAVMDSTSDLIWSEAATSGELLCFNRAFGDFCRRNARQDIAVGLPFSQYMPTKALVERWRALHQHAIEVGSFSTEWETEREVRTLRLSLNPVMRDGHVFAVAAFARDITEDKRLKSALQVSEARYRHIVENAPLGIFRRRGGCEFDYVNSEMLKQFECTSVKQFNRDYAEAHGAGGNPEMFESLVETLRHSGQTQGHELEIRLKNGKVKWLSLAAYYEKDEECINGFSLDVTEKKRLSEMLHQSQKLEAVGQLAGGVAHDFNNSLSAIIGAAELLREDNVSADDRIDYLNLILSAAERAGVLTKKLLAFSRKGGKSTALVNVVDVVKDAVAILRRTLDKRVEIQIDNQAPRAIVVGDDALLQNVLINIGINAGHAMPDGGTLTVHLAVTLLDEDYCLHSPFAIQPGNYLQIDIRDTGCGMSPEVQQRIFEPFFTTKGQGHGTGLGLAAVYGTIQDHHGAITVYSELGGGTVFHVYLPLAPYDTVPPSTEVPVEFGSGTLLVIDDEDLIRITAKALLEGLGYTVLVAENGRAGVDLLSERRGEIKLIILDMIMPVMGGREALKKIREIDATVPVLVCSGFSKEGDLSAMRDLGPFGFLHKPFRRVELSRVVAEALRGRSAEH